MQFKKIYIEITNHCNLKCSFCKTNVREKKYISVNDFELIVNKIKNYTNYVYLHVLGEPLSHKYIDKIILLCKNSNIKVNITSNGTLINENFNKLLNNEIDNIHQINFSLHCEYKNFMNEYDYFKNIIDFTKIAKEKFYINLRLWNENSNLISEHNKNIINMLLLNFGNNMDNFDIFMRNRSIKISNNLYLNLDRKFTWPKKNGKIIFTEGKCFALKDQIGILSDGTIVPCCLDADGEMNLGNIFNDDFLTIIQSEKSLKIRDGFSNKKVVENYCKTCGFAIRNNLIQ